MKKIVCLSDFHLDQKTAEKRAESYKDIARKPKAMYSDKTDDWYVCLAEVEEHKVEQARYYFKSKDLIVSVLIDE